MERVKAVFKWLGRKTAAFVFAALLYAVMTYMKPEAVDAFGMWLAALYGILCGANTAVTVGMKNSPKEDEKG